MIRVLYITRARLSFSRGHTRNIVKTAEALNALPDVSAQVVSSGADTTSAQELFRKHGVKKEFQYETVQSLLRFIFINRSAFDILYFRDPKLFLIAFIARFMLRRKVVFEAHGSHEWRMIKPLWLSSFAVSNGTVFITEKLHTWYDPHKQKPSVVVHANAPAFHLFAHKTEARASIRRTLGIDNDMPLLTYAGNTMWYDVDFLVRLLSQLPRSYMLLVVGLKEDEKNSLTVLAVSLHVEEQLRLVNRVPNAEFVRYLLASDVLLIPPTLTYPGSICSKLYEYMAAGIPIVAYKAGANDEVLQHEKNAFVVESTELSDYVRYITMVVESKDVARQLGEQAAIDSQQYTWETRADRIGRFLKHIAK